MKVYVLIDTDINTVWGTYSKFEKAIAELTEIMKEEHEYYDTMNISMDGANGWVVTMPHENPDCVAHFSIVESIVDED